ncbi:MAG TPA: ribonuclease R [Verrucomicrobiae bacterium]|nr:ribonuclease R [Verrucomicrobiae bacterium]
MDIRQKIQTLLAVPNYRPLRRAELANELRLNPAERREYRRVLDDMVKKGEVARVRKDRFVLSQEADLVAGRIEFNERGFAFVRPEPAAAVHDRREEEDAGHQRSQNTVTMPDIYVAAEDTGVALHGDKVVVRLNRGRIKFKPADKPSGRVIRILERASDTIVGTLETTRQFHYVIPDDPRFQHDVYVTPALNAQVGDKVVVKLAEWKSRHVNPEGELLEVLGKSTAPGVDIVAIIRKYHLAAQHSEQTLAEAERIPERIAAAEYAQRLDLRNKFIITIDPDDAKDFDDAVNVDELSDGGWRLGVHIADVSHYVRPESALDREARARGNSVYLVDRVLPMLPEKLSNNMCSLRPNEDRLTQSVFIEFTPKLAIRKTDFALSVIRSRRRLTYKEAFALLQSGVEAAVPAAKRRASGTDDATRPGGDELTGELRKMWRLALQLRRQRFSRGSLNLDFPEVKVRLDKNGKPTHIEKVHYDISHQLVEEFMLAANEAVAKHICQLPVPCIYRIHEDPDLDKLRDFREYAQSFGYKVGDVAHRQELQKLLKQVAGKPEEYAINLALLRSLKQARYSPKPVGHYGLAKKFYTHFTSPIRRYADLVVHRTLLTLLRKHSAVTDRRYSFGELAKIAEHISTTERVADEAETESVELKKLEYFQQQLASGKLDVMEAVVCTVRNFGIFVELPESLVQGLVHISTLEDDFYHYDEKRERLVGKRTKRVIQIGDKLNVQVERVDVFKRQIDFRVVGKAS